MNALLDVCDLKTYFKTREGLARAVDGVSFEIREGETYALVGESGCGKTVTALSAIQLVPGPAGFHAGGVIAYKGIDIARLPEVEKRRLRGKEISMIFQEPMTSLNPVLTVGFQLMEPLRLHQGLSRAEARKRAIEMLDIVKIPDPASRFEEYPHQLSGGMKQRVMIAMALACEPGLLIADEPTTALDVTIQAQILDLMRELQRKKKTSVLFITHDLGVVSAIADRVGVMYAGRIVETGTTRQILENPAHPYPVRLLQSLPTRQRRDQGLQTIEGRVPAPTRFPPGCRFAERCHKRQDACRRIDPALLDVESGHRAACILYDGGLQGRTVRPEEIRTPPEPKKRAAQGEGSDVLVEVQDLRVHFPVRKGIFKRVVAHVRAVDGVDLSIRRGRTLALVGESGCGKTTLGKAILQLIRPTGGRILVEGSDLCGLDRAALKPFRRRLQVVFQDPYSALNPRMMVREIVTEGMAAHGIGGGRREREAIAAEILARVGLDPEMMDRYPHEFSGGQRQRIGIARCLAVGPAFIVCDEATSSLDVSVQAQILNLLQRLQAEEGLTYLFITHNLSVVEYFADEVAVMYLGRIVERGKAEEVFTDPLHPYTRALLAAIPRIDPETGVEKIRLGGDVPSPVHPPPGCHFHPRCPIAIRGLCEREYPRRFETGGRTVFCHAVERSAGKMSAG
ncbi:MAG: ABC transporter ATP-binding protein [Planctomycetota bacterium]